MCVDALSLKEWIDNNLKGVLHDYEEIQWPARFAVAV